MFDVAIPTGLASRRHHVTLSRGETGPSISTIDGSWQRIQEQGVLILQDGCRCSLVDGESRVAQGHPRQYVARFGSLKLGPLGRHARTEEGHDRR